MKTTVSSYDFEQAFRTAGRENSFSYAGRNALFNYMEDYEEDTGEEIELDVIALCCEYTEYVDVQEFAAAYSDDYIVWKTEPEEPQPVYIAGWNMPGYMPDSEPAQFDDADDAREYILDELQNVIDGIEDSEPADESTEDAADHQDRITALQFAITTLKDSTDTEQGFYAGQYFFFITVDSTEAVEGEIDYEATLDKIRNNTQVIDIDGESFIIQDF